MLADIDEDVKKVISDHVLLLGLDVPSIVAADISSGLDLNGAQPITVLIGDDAMRIRSPRFIALKAITLPSI